MFTCPSSGSGCAQAAPNRRAASTPWRRGATSTISAAQGSSVMPAADAAGLGADTGVLRVEHMGTHDRH